MRSSFFSSLRVRLLLLVLVGAVPAVSFMLLTSKEWYEVELLELQTDAARLAGLVAADKEYALGMVRETLASVARLPPERVRDRAECRTLLSLFWTEPTRFRSLGLMDATGRLLCGLGEADDDVAQRSEVRHTIATGAFAADDHIVPGTMGGTMGFAYPAVDAAGRLRGVAFGTLDLAHLGKMAAGIEVPAGVSVTLIDEHGTVLARHPDAARWVGTSAAGAEIFRTVYRPERTPHARDLDGTERVFALHPIVGAPPPCRLGVAVGIAPEVAAHHDFVIIKRGVTRLTVVAVFALFIAWVGADAFLVRPVKKLGSAARRVTLGDLGARTGIQYGAGELCELARAFDEMATALERRQAETEQARAALRAAHDELETRVRERTAELVGANAALQKLSSAVEQATDSVMITDRTGRIEYVNPAFERLTGFTAAEVTGQTPRVLKSGTHDDAFYRRLWETVSAGEVFATVVINRKKDGAHYYEEKTIVPLRDAQGQITHFVAAGRDISDRKRAEAELRGSREQLRVFAAHLERAREDERARIAREIHDELGQALTSLRFELCRLGAARPDNVLDVRQATRSMVDMVDGTIDSVRRIATQLRPGVLDDLGLVAAIEWQAGEFERRTGIRCRFTPNPEEMEVDSQLSTAVFRILQETLTNVARHAGATRADIDLTLDGRRLTLVVRDDGRGITEAERADLRSLGLLGMRERALLLGGVLSVSGAAGSGTTVTLEIAAATPVSLAREPS